MKNFAIITKLQSNPIKVRFKEFKDFKTALEWVENHIDLSEHPTVISLVNEEATAVQFNSLDCCYIETLRFTYYIDFGFAHEEGVIINKWKRINL